MVTAGEVLKVVHLATSDVVGGAAKASFVLQQELRHIGVDQDMLVMTKGSEDGHVFQLHSRTLKTKVVNRLLGEVNSYLLDRYFKPWEYWSLGLGRKGIAEHVLIQQADVITMSWVSNLLSVEEITRLLDLGKPVIWTLYDMWALTAGCHYSQFCSQYKTQCIHCHQLSKAGGDSLVDFVWARKERLWKNLKNLTIVCPSHWLADCVRNSALLSRADIQVIPQGVNVESFRPKDKSVCRNALNLPQDKKLLLFIAGNGFYNERKGGLLFLQALKELAKVQKEMPDIVILGSNHVPEQISGHFNCHFPSISNESALVSLYAASNVVVVPSKEDNLPLTLLEAMACGVPCCSFDVGGMNDVVTHKKNGYLAQAFDVEDFSLGLQWLLYDCDLKFVSLAARETVKHGFTTNQEALMYRQLFEGRLAFINEH